MALTNAEKQKRFRRVEELKKWANEQFFYWQTVASGSLFRQFMDPQEAKQKLDEIVNLPNGWTEDDYQAAVTKVKNFTAEIHDNPHLLENDLVQNYDVIFSPKPREEMEKFNRAKMLAPDLISNIQSLFRLAEFSAQDQSAVLLELMRRTGRRLLDEPRIFKSNANAMSLASIGQQYKRPEWFAKYLARVLVERMEAPLAEQLAAEIADYAKDNRKKLFDEPKTWD